MKYCVQIVVYLILHTKQVSIEWLYTWLPFWSEYVIFQSFYRWIRTYNYEAVQSPTKFTLLSHLVLLFDA